MPKGFARKESAVERLHFYISFGADFARDAATKSIYKANDKKQFYVLYRRC
jgi:hypothetical protein